MTFYTNLSVRHKLIIGYASMLLLCCLIGFFSIRSISAIKSRIDYIHDRQMPAIVGLNELGKSMRQHRRSSMQYLLSNQLAHRSNQEDQVNIAERKTKELLENLSVSPKSQLDETLLADAVKLINEYLTASKIIKKKAQSGIDFKKLDDEIEKAHAIFTRFEALLDQLIKLNTDEINTHYQETNTSYNKLQTTLYLLITFSTLLAVAMVILLTRSISGPLTKVLEAILLLQEGSRRKALLTEAVAAGDLDQEVEITKPFELEMALDRKDEAGMLLKAVVEMSELQSRLDHSFAKMTKNLRHDRNIEQQHNWLKSGQFELNRLLRGENNSEYLAEQVLIFLSRYLGAAAGAFYVFDENESELCIIGGYALSRQNGQSEKIALGDGLLGQAALDKKVICLNQAPKKYLRISSGLGEADPASIVVLPLLYNDDLMGAMELGSFSAFSELDLEFLSQCSEALAIALSVNQSRQKVFDLLEQAQSQSEELRVQQEELQQTNEELEERSQMLEQQRESIRTKNLELEHAGRALRHKAEELEKVSAYKSEFLANMSHELRTPLNSLMILSSILKDNRDGNLTPKQVEFAATINGAGRDLLELINDILDLSKIESGHVDFHYEDVGLSDLCTQLAATFAPIAHDKGIGFVTEMSGLLPETIRTDSQRTMQILKNLLSNACKFTNQGEVTLRIFTPEATTNPLADNAVAFTVSDTGIGIHPDKHALIFNAFQQADGSTSRTYGGTGLGLSISRHLARSMGGEIHLSSEPGTGSAFTLYLPVEPTCRLQPTVVEPVSAPVQPQIHSQQSHAPGSAPLPGAPIPDDREQISLTSRSILIVEDDLSFAAILADMVRNRGFCALVAADGESGITIAQHYHPSAIILDVMLPRLDGWGVMRSLKDNPSTRHIPVHFITCLDDSHKAMGMGAVGFVTKPVGSEQLDSVFNTLETAIDKTMKSLLIVEDDEIQANAMVALLEERNVAIKVADSGEKAMELLAREPFDCIVLDLGLADMGAFELLEELNKLYPKRNVPVIIHTGRELSREDERRLHHYAESIIIKGVKSPERLLNEVTLFLHLIETSLDPGKQKMIRSALDKEAMLEGKKILIVDDDMRNIFSLSSALSEKNMVIYEAENGREALQKLELHPDTDLVLMDIMMPEMDGYEAMKAIRSDQRFKSMPIIALTAKAMKGDREECMNAGASDYIPKPVDMEKLFSMLRVWLYRPIAADSVNQ